MSVFYSTHSDKDLNDAVAARAAQLQVVGGTGLSAVAPPPTCHPQTSIPILRLTEVIDRVGLCRASIYQYIATGSFPKQITLGPRSVGWIEHEIDACLAVRALIDARTAELAAISRNAAIEIAGRRKAFADQYGKRGGKNIGQPSLGQDAPWMGSFWLFLSGI